MTDVKVAVLLARLENVLESARLDYVIMHGSEGAPLEHIKRAQQLVEQIRGEL